MRVGEAPYGKILAHRVCIFCARNHELIISFLLAFTKKAEAALTIRFYADYVM